MATGKARVVPAGLERLRQRFEEHRGAQKGRSRIPKTLWAAAVRMAAVHGVNRTAQTLRLDYYALKKRLERQSAAGAASKAGGTTGFIEIAPLTSVGSSECLLKLEKAGKSTMRIRLKSIAMPDLVGICRSFWDCRS